MFAIVRFKAFSIVSLVAVMFEKSFNCNVFLIISFGISVQLVIFVETDFIVTVDVNTAAKPIELICFKLAFLNSAIFKIE